MKYRRTFLVFFSEVYNFVEYFTLQQSLENKKMTLIPKENVSAEVLWYVN